MTRSGTTIWHDILISESVSKMPDAKMRLIFIGLLMACDDWGRFPDNPHKLFMSMPAFGITPDDIRAAIDWLDGECIARYTARLSDGDRAVTVCQFVNWDEYQWRLKSRDNAKYPSKDGKLEGTTNPLALSRGDRAVTAPQPNEMKGKETKGREKNKTGKSKKIVPEPSPKALGFVEELFPDMESSQQKAGAVILDEIAKHDKMPLDTLMPALRWARNNVIEVTNKKDWSGWKKYFRSCAALRNRKHGKSDDRKWKKIYDQYQDQLLATKKSELSEPEGMMKFNVDDETTWPKEEK